MENKKTISLSGFFVILMIIILIIMGYFLLKTRTEKLQAEERTEYLKDEINHLESAMDNLQDKMDNNYNTVANNETSTQEKENGTTNVTKIEGIFENTADPEIHTYAFEQNKVTYQSLETVKGTYEIVGDKIKITYTESYDPEGNKMSSFPNGQKEELIIVNEDTITNSNTKYTKIKMDGTYENHDEPEAISYTFSGNTVTYEAMAKAKGTYEIVGDKIKITYTESYDPEGNKMSSFPNGQKEELMIIGGNKIANDNITFEKK